MKRGFPVVVWILLGLLGLAAFVLSLGQRDLFVNPSINSFGPSGTSALAQLLRDRGHRVDVDRRARPRMAKNDVALAFAEYSSEAVTPEETNDLETIGESLRKHAESGGSVVIVELPKHYQDVSRRILNGGAVEADDLGRRQKYQVAFDDAPETQPLLAVTDSEDASVQLWTAEESDYLRGYRVGKGTVLVVKGGVGFTNRFLDRQDNAAASVSILELVARREGAGRIVFTEASFGNERTVGLLEAIGTWAVASWYQLLFLFAVVIFTLGRRFGYAEVDPFRQRGARELLDAISDTYMRGRHAQIALRIILARVESELRAALRLGRDFEISARDERLSPEMRQAMAEAYAALTWDRLRGQDALPIVQKLLKAKSDFVQGRRQIGV